MDQPDRLSNIGCVTQSVEADNQWIFDGGHERVRRTYEQIFNCCSSGLGGWESNIHST